MTLPHPDMTALRDAAGTDFKAFTSADAAIDHLCSLYAQSVERLHAAFKARQGCPPGEATYPCLALELPPGTPLTGRPPFDVILDPGFYSTTITRPALFREYLREQITPLLHHYGQPVLVGRSRHPIPLPYVMEEAATGLTEADLLLLQEQFALPNLHATDDSIANCELLPDASRPRPLALFTAERTDYSLARLHHYTGTTPGAFQRFILLTNYQRYVETFRAYARAQVDAGGDYTAFIEPGDQIYTGPGSTPPEAPAGSLPQMPAYHLCRPDGDGITLIN
ncbi:MAG: AMP nucleosidase, partial [Acetobacter persici]